MRLGIIGAGQIVQEFLPKLVTLDGMEIIAIQSMPFEKRNVEKLCKKNGIPYSATSLEELLNYDIDTVYVAVPNFMHYTCSRNALEKGLNVIVEKPIASNDREAKELKTLATSKQLFCFEAVTTPYFDGYEKIRQWLGEIGKIKMVHCNYSQYSRRYDDFKAGVVLPAFDPTKSGGALMDLNLYNLHFVLGLFGMPQKYKYYPNIERNIDTSGTLVLQYPNFIGTCTAAKDCTAPYSFVIEGENGYITTQYPPNLIGEVTLKKRDGTIERYDDGMASQRLVPEFKFFIDCINRQDFEACEKRLNQSISVSEVQTKARLEAGVFFPADKEKEKVNA